MSRTRRTALVIAASVSLLVSSVPAALAAPTNGVSTTVAAASVALTDLAADALVLAVEAEPEGPLPGPEPDTDPESNEFAPSEYEPPWTQWLGVILTLTAILFVLGVGIGYWLLVKRPEDRSRT